MTWQWLLIVGLLGLVGLAAIGLYRRMPVLSRRATRRSNGTQEATVVVDRGYVPSQITLEAGVPAVLRFQRRDNDPCTELLVCELLPSEHRLAAYAQTLIRFTPQRPGRYAFTCGMGMYSGELVVHPAHRKES